MNVWKHLCYMEKEWCYHVHLVPQVNIIHWNPMPFDADRNIY